MNNIPKKNALEDESKGTPQFLVVQNYHTENHGDFLNTSAIMYVPVAAQAPGSPRIISKSCLSAEQNPRSYWSLQLTALKGSATREKKNRKTPSLHRSC